MKLFIKNTLIFLSVLYGGVLVLMVLSNYIINSKANFKLETNINKIVLGNSHPAGTFNDSLISNFKNISDPGDCYFYSYQKLKELLKQNHQIDTVYIEFNPKTILVWEDSKLWKKHQIANYLPFFKFEDHRLLIQDNSLSYQQEALKGIASSLRRIAINKYNYIESIGGYRYVNTSRIVEILDTLTYNPEKQLKVAPKDLSKYDIIYLKKIIELCNDKSIKAIFVRSPYHKMFDGHRYEDYFQRFRKENFSNIPFQDFQDFSMIDDEFKDLEHLNYKGARRFSLWFNIQSNK